MNGFIVLVVLSIIVAVLCAQLDLGESDFHDYGWNGSWNGKFYRSIK